MRAKIALITIVALVATASASAAPLDRVDTVATRLEWVGHRLAIEQWHDATGRSADSLAFFEHLYRHLLADQAVLDHLKGLYSSNLAETDARRVLILLTEAMRCHIDETSEVIGLVDSLEVLSRGASVRIGESSQLVPDWQRTLSLIPSAAGRSEIAEALAPAQAKAAEMAMRLVRLRNQAAERAGFNSYLALRLYGSGMTVEQVRVFIDQTRRASDELYRSALNTLKSRSNLLAAELWDIPYLEHAAVSDLDPYLTPDSHLVVLKAGLRSLGLNLDNFPIYTDSADSFQPSRVFAVSIPHDIRLALSSTDGAVGYLELAHATGRAVHLASIEQTDPIFKRLVPAAWTIAMGRLMERVASQPEFVGRTIVIAQPVIDRYTELLKASQVVRLRRLLLAADFELSIYANPNQNANRLFWHLAEQYFNISKHEDRAFWIDSYFSPLERLLALDHLYAELAAAQSLTYLKNSYDLSAQGDKYAAFLVQNYYRFGARYSWREMLERGVGDTLNARAILEP